MSEGFRWNVETSYRAREFIELSCVLFAWYHRAKVWKQIKKTYRREKENKWKRWSFKFVLLFLLACSVRKGVSESVRSACGSAEAFDGYEERRLGRSMREGLLKPWQLWRQRREIELNDANRRRAIFGSENCRQRLEFRTLTFWGGTTDGTIIEPEYFGWRAVLWIIKW